MAQTILISDCALAYVRTSAGGYAQVFYGDVVPDGYDEGDAQRLLDEGFLRKGTAEEVGGLVAAPLVPGGVVPGTDPDDSTAGAAASTPAPAGDATVNERSTHAELDDFAAAHNVDLSGATTKAEKLDKINASS